MPLSNMNVVVLAAGRGERFVTAGVTIPKPLINFHGRSLLGRTLDYAAELLAVNGSAGRLIVVTTPQVAFEAAHHKGVTHVVEVSVTQPGPAASGLLACAHLPPEEPVIFMDCDNLYLDKPPALEVASCMFVSKDLNGLPPENFCNVGVIERNGAVVNIVEKERLQEHPTVGVGVYGFTSASSFYYSAQNRICDHSREVPMSAVIASQVIVKSVFVDNWLPLGTPEQLAAADRRWSQR